MENSKFFDVVGEVVDRIHNPRQQNKEGKPFRLCWLVLKWVTGTRGEFIDYLPLKTFKPELLDNIRIGYIVKVTVLYRCNIFGDEIKYRYTGEDNNITSPQLYPDFIISSKEIEIINSRHNYEEHTQENEKFEEEFIEQELNDKNEPDLPF